MIQPLNTGLELMRMAGQNGSIDGAGRRAANDRERTGLAGSNFFNSLDNTALLGAPGATTR